jgi:O-antigen/teichoic acid export membrane protein
VAVYTFSLRPIKELKKPLGSLNKLTLPKLSQRDPEELKRSIPAKMLKMLAVLIPVTGLYILIAPYFYQLLFPQYIEATAYSQVFALSLLFFPKMLMGQSLTAHARKKQLYILNISTPALKIILLVSLLPFFGIWGAMIAMLATELFNTILLLFLFRFHKEQA